MNKITGMQGVIIFLFGVVTFGTLHLLCASFPDNRVSQAWTSLGF